MVSPADELIDALADAGATSLFGLPGGGANLDVVGAALNRGLDFVLAHGENAAAIMGSTHGLLTSAPTPVVVTRGPGATSVTNGAAQATLDRYPLVVITDTVADVDRARVAHQRLDQRALFGPITKLTARLGSDAVPSVLRDLAALPTTWPHGAVHVDYDPRSETQVTPVGPQRDPVGGHAVDEAELARARALVNKASRPVVIVGMEAAVLGGRALGDVLLAAGLPVLTTYQAIGMVPTESDIAAGLFTNGALEAPVLGAADAIITIGLDVVEPIPAPWQHQTPLIALSTSDVISPYFPDPDALLHGDLVTTTKALIPTGTRLSTDWDIDAGARFRRAARTQIVGDAVSDERFGPIALVQAAADSVPADATTTVDAGAHFLAVMPLWPCDGPFGLLISNGLATMGFALPAAIGAALARPTRPVLALTGDGGLGMALAELETVARLNLPITVVVFNDSTLSLIKIKQKPGHGGGRAVAYGPTDFSAVARASGLDAAVVTSAAELRNELAMGWDRPRLIDARIDPSDYPRLINATRG